MERVRESIDHLVGLGRFEDVRVFADASDTRPGGVTLRWVLVPVQRIAEIEFAGNPGVSRNSLRAEITERVGSLPVTSRVPEIEEAVRTFYAERGYRQPVVRAQLVPGEEPDRTTLTFTVDAGRRTTIGEVSVDSESPYRLRRPQLSGKEAEIASIATEVAK